MTPRNAWAALLCTALLAACSSPESRAARAAERMNKAGNANIESVRAEGNRLIVRHREFRVAGLSDDELKRMLPAGLCEIEEVADFIGDGGAIRVELPRGFDHLSIDIDRCSA